MVENEKTALCLGDMFRVYAAALVSGGRAVNAFSVAQPYILAQNGFSNTQTSMITTVRAAAYLGCMALMPRFYGRLGYRWGTAAAALFGVLAFVLFGAAKQLWTYYLAGLVAGLSYGFGSMVPVSILITRWFREKHGLALGICAAGTGPCGRAVTFAAYDGADRKIFPRRLFYVMAGVSLLLTLIVFLLVRESPEGCGKTAYGAAVQAENTEAASGGAELSCGRWTALFVSMCFLGAIASPGFTHMMILFSTDGIPESTAALCVSIFGLALMLGKCVYGEACDLLGAKRASWIFGAILSAGLILCTLSGLASRPLALTAAVLYGFGVPMSTVGLSVWAEAFSGAKRYDEVIRLFQTGYGLGALVFSFMPGLFADACGSYAPSYLVFLAFGVFSLLVVQSTYRRTARAALFCKSTKNAGQFSPLLSKTA